MKTPAPNGSFQGCNQSFIISIVTRDEIAS